MLFLLAALALFKIKLLSIYRKSLQDQPVNPHLAFAHLCIKLSGGCGLVLLFKMMSCEVAGSGPSRWASFSDLFRGQLCPSFHEQGCPQFCSVGCLGEAR